MEDATPLRAQVYSAAVAWLEAEVARLKQDQMRALREAFVDLVDASSTQPATVGQTQTFTGRNRYNNVFPYDFNRVTLHVQPGSFDSDYINASLVVAAVPGSPDAHYIATQGPLPDTVPDFWRMIYERNCEAVVMLTQIFENNVVKCAPYVPRGVGTTDQHGDLQLTLLSEAPLAPGVTLRTMELVAGSTGARRVVRQYQYDEWRDHHVPASTAGVRDIAASLQPRPQQASPVVVHCSAGIGRTGTFIAADVVLRRLAALAAAAPAAAATLTQVHAALNVVEVVNELRRQRDGMVQSPEQLLFVFQAILDECRAQLAAATAAPAARAD